MILWTIQRLEDYEKYKSSGVLIANEASFAELDENSKQAYDWLAGKMEERGLPRPEGTQYPVWAWYQWEGKRKRRDLRASGYAPAGTKMVQLTINVPEKEVLLSDFDAWHFVLIGSYCSLSREEEKDFYNDDRNIFNPRLAIRRSWDRIFDIDHDDQTGWLSSIEEKSIQASIWCIKPEYILKTEFFTAK